MMTGRTGTSSMKPLDPVGARPILRTTSISGDDFTENSVTVLRGCAVKEVVVFQVDEELAGSRIRIVRTGHCNGTDGVFQTVLIFEFDRSVRALLMQIAVKTAALNHEVVDDAMENRTVIKTFFCILDEVKLLSSEQLSR